MGTETDAGGPTQDSFLRETLAVTWWKTWAAPSPRALVGVTSAASKGGDVTVTASE